MPFLARLRRLFRPGPQEQVLGYSIEQLKTQFGGKASLDVPAPCSGFTLDLMERGVGARYWQILLDASDGARLWSLIDQGFEQDGEGYCSREGGKRLLLKISDREFNALTVRLVTDSEALLVALNEVGFAPPPPWVAFPEFEARWWVGNMQGGQAYYEDLYLAPWFKAQGAEGRKAWFDRFEASDAWRQQLEERYQPD
ncbi:hypothetical protein KSS94_24560 [Pseudomonas fakonensis]|uniref:Uncharacterized protein n=1 Tax=Pseudomonas fakonensis TaxID=2842355 RepID=A0ABX8N6T5_9PSED|nr:hypothetical protein [Pseudomonas fakonensis]QXH51072.1 hypothetical protein KSS94_24560 [Pseudomonas fakonensis]